MNGLFSCHPLGPTFVPTLNPCIRWHGVSSCAGASDKRAPLARPAPPSDAIPQPRKRRHRHPRQEAITHNPGLKCGCPGTEPCTRRLSSFKQPRRLPPPTPAPENPFRLGKGSGNKRAGTGVRERWVSGKPSVRPSSRTRSSRNSRAAPGSSDPPRDAASHPEYSPFVCQ